MAGTLREIVLSWTLVRYGKFPYDNPSFKVVLPVPDALLDDLSTTIKAKNQKQAYD